MYDLRWVRSLNIEAVHRLALRPQFLSVREMPHCLIQDLADDNCPITSEAQAAHCIPTLHLPLSDGVGQLVQDTINPVIVE